MNGILVCLADWHEKFDRRGRKMKLWKTGRKAIRTMAKGKPIKKRIVYVNDFDTESCKNSFSSIVFHIQNKEHSLTGTHSVLFRCTQEGDPTTVSTTNNRPNPSFEGFFCFLLKKKLKTNDKRAHARSALENVWLFFLKQKVFQTLTISFPYVCDFHLRGGCIENSLSFFTFYQFHWHYCN